jgi:hypothetical protein
LSSRVPFGCIQLAVVAAEVAAEVAAVHVNSDEAHVTFWVRLTMMQSLATCNDDDDARLCTTVQCTVHVRARHPGCKPSASTCTRRADDRPGAPLSPPQQGSISFLGIRLWPDFGIVLRFPNDSDPPRTPRIDDVITKHVCLTSETPLATGDGRVEPTGDGRAGARSARPPVAQLNGLRLGYMSWRSAGGGPLVRTAALPWWEPSPNGQTNDSNRAAK